jgi:hypothetical protein
MDEVAASFVAMLIVLFSAGTLVGTFFATIAALDWLGQRRSLRGRDGGR